MYILILGYYDRFNLGDDMYKNAFQKLLPNHNLSFKCIDDIEELKDLNKFDCIIVGGGDIINDYFYEKISSIKSVYSKCIYAVSIGIPYKELIEKDYLKFYDRVFTRNKAYLTDIQHAIGSQYVHYIPDITMKSFDIYEDNVSLESRNTIGSIFIMFSI